MEMAKSKVECACGRSRMSATSAECGWWVRAIRVRFVDLLGFGRRRSGGDEVRKRVYFVCN